MSKGKRKSVPGSCQMVRTKLRLGTLSGDDRDLLFQVSRLDLIEIIESEMPGVRLTGSQKNSVAAMVNWLLDEKKARRGPRSRRGVSCKRRAGPRGPDVEEGAARNHGAAAQGCSGLRGQPALPGAAGGHNDSDNGSCGAGGGPALERAASGESSPISSAAAAAAGGGADTSCRTGCESDAGQAAPGAQQQRKQRHWLEELQLQLAAAATATADPGTPGDEAGTAESAPRARGSDACLAGGAGAPAGGQGQLQAEAADDALENQLLQQLLQDMQLGPQQQQEQPQLQLNRLHTPPLQQPQLLPPEQVQRLEQHRQHLLQQQQQLEQQRQLLLQQQQLLLQQEQQQQQQQQRWPAGAFAGPGWPGGCVQSCPLPSTAPGNLHGELPVLPDVRALSSVLPTWHGANSMEAEEPPTSSKKREKRGRRSLFWHPGARPPAEEATGRIASAPPLFVERSGPSGDVATKRSKSFQQPGCDAVVALPTLTARGHSRQLELEALRRAALGLGAPDGDGSRSAAAAADSSSQELPPLHMRQQPQLQQPQLQQPQLPQKQHAGLKKGMKKLAGKFKALLGGRPAAAPPAATQPQRLPSSFGSPDGQPTALRVAYALDSMTADEVLAGTQGGGSMGMVQGSATGTSGTWSVAAGSALGAGSGLLVPSVSSAHSLPQGVAMLPPACLQLHSFGSSTHSSMGQQGAYDNFGQKLQVLRALYGGQYEDAAKPQLQKLSLGPAHRGGSAGWGLPGAAEVPHMPCVKEERDAVGASDSPQQAHDGAAAAEVHGAGSSRKLVVAPGASSPGPLIHKVTWHLGPNCHGAGMEDAAAAAAMLDRSGSGLLVTERSSSSFSLFLAHVANGWRHDGGMRHGAADHKGAAMPSMRQEAGGSLAMPGVEHSSRSFTRLFGSCGGGGGGGGDGGGGSSTAAAAPEAHGVHGVERSPSSFGRLFGACAGAGAGAAAPETRGVHGVERSPSSFGRLFGACAGAGAGAAAPEAHGVHGVERSASSFGRLFGACAGAGAGAAAPETRGVHGVERSASSFGRLFGACAGAGAGAAAPETRGVHGVERSASSFGRLFGACAGAGAGAAAPEAHGVHGVERSASSFGRLFGACGHCGGGAGVDGEGAGAPHSPLAGPAGAVAPALAGPGSAVDATGQQQQGPTPWQQLPVLYGAGEAPVGLNAGPLQAAAPSACMSMLEK